MNIGLPTGVVVAFAGDKSKVPVDWALCDGSMVSSQNTDYLALFQLIGTTYGGDGKPNFQLPDYRGMFLRGVDDGAGRDPDAATRTAAGTNQKGNSGVKVGSIQQDGVVSHTHDIDGKSLEADSGSGFSGTGLASNSKDISPWDKNTSTLAFGGKETRPKNVYVNYIIRL